MPPFRLPLFLASVAAFGFAGADRQDPHNYDLVDVNWHIAFDASARTIRGDVTNTLTLKERRSDSIWFDCGPLTIEEVSVDGAKAISRQENERLIVTLPKTGHQGQKLKVRIQYGGSPTAGVYFVSSEHGYPANV